MEQLDEKDSRNEITGLHHTKQKRDRRQALDMGGAIAPLLDYIDSPLLVRITRIAQRRLDDDNMSGGCKQLRDAIASAFGRQGDSETDGLWWEYRQEKGPYEIVIEVFEK
jgi:hypothetical protein